nr:hypothetical protein [Tanacetum cinerariifolium]
MMKGSDIGKQEKKEKLLNEWEKASTYTSSTGTSCIIILRSSSDTSSEGEGLGTPTEPYHTPSPEAHQSPYHDLSSLIHPPVTTATIPTVIPTDNPPLRQYTRRARIAQSSALPTTADEPASLLRDDSQDLEIASLKAKIKLLEDKDEGGVEPSGEDATIKGRSLETREEAAVEKSIERGSNDTEELVNVLTSLDAANILTSRGVQVIARDAEIARIHAEEELQMLINSLDRNNETVAKYLHEYEQFPGDLSIEERIELINDLVKYQDNYAKVLKYQSQQRKPLSKKQQKEFYMSVLKSHSGWKAKHFDKNRGGPKLADVGNIDSGIDSQSVPDMGSHNKIHYLVKVGVVLILLQDGDHIMIVTKRESCHNRITGY